MDLNHNNRSIEGNFTYSIASVIAYSCRTICILHRSLAPEKSFNNCFYAGTAAESIHDKEIEITRPCGENS